VSKLWYYVWITAPKRIMHLTVSSVFFIVLWWNINQKHFSFSNTYILLNTMLLYRAILHIAKYNSHMSRNAPQHSETYNRFVIATDIHTSTKVCCKTTTLEYYAINNSFSGWSFLAAASSHDSKIKSYLYLKLKALVKSLTTS